MDSKMLENLVKTWVALAPDEVRLDEWGGVWLNDRYSASFGFEFLNGWSLLPFEQFLLQGYVQQCIEARGWEYEVYGNSIGRSFKNHCVVSTGDYSTGESDKGVLLNLLSAYLVAISDTANNPKANHSQPQEQSVRPPQSPQNLGN